VWGAEKNILGGRRDELAQMTLRAARDVSRDLGFLEPVTAPAVRRETAPALA
jgi:hypothetical protein